MRHGVRSTRTERMRIFFGDCELVRRWRRDKLRAALGIERRNIQRLQREAHV